ncbi:AsnC family transcriptional regulator [Mesorhizobium sp. Root157]|uniref:GntR family transcriptional regulator n=1 Tax=Mesorhizobium sp. Root157 TaxID=1736477 RepID=UPI0006FDC63C|nr:GntR family transcriptional regulator [Mesorhizobium sp. Root157]KQZ94113.1 AsnC family transcriptional regulator [Mesorhizobium sp. Root157]
MALRNADRIREELEQAIMAGEFGDGERLDEMTLSTRFSVSRTPVREALHALAASGLVETIPRRGVFVRYPSFIKLIEMFDVMAELEAMCGRLAARRITDEELDRLEAAAIACQKAEEKGDTDEYYRENERFHHVLYHASGNSFLAQEASKLHKRLKPFRRLQLRVRGRLGQSMQEHREVQDAIQRGDAERAARTLRSHIAIQGENLNDLMANFAKYHSRVPRQKT